MNVLRDVPNPFKLQTHLRLRLRDERIRWGEPRRFSRDLARERQLGGEIVGRKTETIDQNRWKLINRLAVFK
jgi:hypothetical protein